LVRRTIGLRKNMVGKEGIWKKSSINGLKNKTHKCGKKKRGGGKRSHVMEGKKNQASNQKREMKQPEISWLLKEISEKIGVQGKYYQRGETVGEGTMGGVERKLWKKGR